MNSRKSAEIRKLAASTANPPAVPTRATRNPAAAGAAVSTIWLAIWFSAFAGRSSLASTSSGVIAEAAGKKKAWTIPKRSASA